jgi:transcriptional antiterminator
MNQKLSWWDRISIQFKRNVRGWTIKKIAKHYGVTTRTIYRVLEN